MWDSVKQGFRAFTLPLEGEIAWMYLDTLGLVTVGLGNLIDPVELALELPFVYRATPDVMASHEDIRAEWQAVKANTSLAKAGALSAGRVTKLGLSVAAREALVERRLAQNETSIMRLAWAAKWATWPADAQLGIMSMAWAMGAGRFAAFPNFRAAMTAGDFAGAAQHCAMSDKGGDISRRNHANVMLFRNAAQVVAKALDPSVLHYPMDLSIGAPA